LSSRYFRPSVDRGRTVTSESLEIGSMRFSSLSWSEATGTPLPVVRASISVTTPTRFPPTRTSLPTVSSAASGTSARML
jgi:hypothetical protein